MKKFRLLYSTLSILFLAYLLLPAPNFPNPPHDAFQSQEEADTETPLRRAYFTNYTREQVREHYKNQFNKNSLVLNYPPEDAQTLIRDQTRSVYLEELVHPFRGSIFANGFEPRQAKDDIWYRGVHYQAKITVKYAYSSVWVRLALAAASIVLGWFVISMWKDSLVDFRNLLSWRKK